MFSGDHEKWTLEEKIRLLELFIDKDSGLWEDRANALQQEFGGKRPTDFFTQITVKRELNNIFNKPNPEHHVFGMPTHSRGKEAAELWLKHFRRELEVGRERRKQMFMVAMRKQLDLIRRYQQGKLPKEELDALLEEARERDAQRPDKEQHEEKIKQHMEKAYFEDVKNVRTFADYFRFLRGIRIPTPPRSPTPVKVLDEECPGIVEPFQDTKQVRKTENGPTEPTDIGAKQQRMPRMQIAATPPTEKPKQRKRRHEPYDEIDADEKPIQKRLRTSSKTMTGGSDAIFTFEAVTSLYISLDKSKELIGESEARINLRQMPQFESIALGTRVAKYAEANEKFVLTNSGPEEFKEHTIPIRQKKCIENGIPIIAKGREKTIDTRQVRKKENGPTEPTDIGAKQQRMPRMQIAATPPTEKPKQRKRKADLSGDETKETYAESEKPPTKQSIKKEPADDKSLSSSTLSSPQSFAATPSQPLFSEVAATAKLRSQLRRAAIATSTPSPAVDNVADKRLFLKPGKLSSTEVIPKQILLTLWRDIHSHRFASVFSYPVSEELVPGYHTEIEKPMDLKTLKTNIEGDVNTLGKFSHAILQMFGNAVMYNSTGHYVNNYAKEMAAYALKCIEVVQFPAGQFHVAPPSRQSNGSSTEGGAAGGGGATKFPIAWATTLIKPKGVDQKKAKGRSDEDKSTSSSSSSSQETKETELNHRTEGETRHIFQRRRLYNKKYTFSSML